MIYKIDISDEAAEDIREIYKYIAFDLTSPANASGQIARIEAAIKSLNSMPKRFRKYEKGIWAERELRIMPVDNSCVFYIANEANSRVVILRVMYDGRNIDSVFNKSK